MTNEQILTKFMADHYSDERLAMLLAHAEDGKLSYHSCCCFIGIANADHALLGERTEPLEDGSHWIYTSHYRQMKNLPGATFAEHAFCRLSETGSSDERRAKLIPLIKAEMARRVGAVEPAEELITV